ncbi:MAG: HlyD family efflux transporter periplasmic adaptor subunit [Gammaproteobacteria bacterium]|nr:HlyD family efflux transporter periplasmic adaptor subunit [Gammaproteobacteria bacterium]
MRTILILACILLTGCEQYPENIALGTLERDRIAHTATINEVIVELPVAQGSLVTKGTLIVKLDDTLQKTMVSKAAAEVAQAEANLEKLRSGARIEDVAAARANVAAAEATLVESKANYARAVELRRLKTISVANLDKTLALRDADLAKLESTKEELLKLTNGTRIEDLRQAEALLDAAVAVLDNENKKLSDLSVHATRDGILDNLPWNLGERVTTGSPLAIVLAGKAPYARIYVPEPYRVKVNVGDELTIRIDGLENTITGTLRWISTEPAFTPYYALNQEERSRLMYLAEVQLPDSQSHLPNGVPAQVELP